MKTFARLTGCALALGTFFGALLAAPPVQAQDFSGKPIRMIVGLAAGGATDVMAYARATVGATVSTLNDVVPCATAALPALPASS